MKIGLVLEGGGMRGVYTVGVLDAFTKHNFMPDYLIVYQLELQMEYHTYQDKKEELFVQILNI